MGFQYQNLANELRNSILIGELVSNTKLPAVRVLAKNRNISVNTVMRAYEELESQGLVYSIPKTGFFIRPRKEKSAQLASTSHCEQNDDHESFNSFSFEPKQIQLTHRMQALQSKLHHPSFVNLATAQINNAWMPIEPLQRSLWRTSRQFGQRCQSYGNIMGEPELVDAITSHLSDQFLFDLPKNNLVITNGCMEAVALAIQATTHGGDTILVPSPCFSGILTLLESLERKVIEIPITNNKIDLELVENLFASNKANAMVLTSRLQNPTGSSFDRDHQIQLLKIVSRHRIPIIEDDIYSDCHHHSDIPHSLKSIDTNDWVIYCNSFSKTLAPGYRLGWCYTHRFYKAIETLKLARNLYTPVPTQLCVADFINRGLYKKHLRNLNHHLAKSCSYLTQYIYDHFPKLTQVSQPLGGLVLWVKLPKPNQGNLLTELALNKGIGIYSGQFFSTTDHYNQYVRINFGRGFNSQPDLNQNLKLSEELSEKPSMQIDPLKTLATLANSL